MMHLSLVSVPVADQHRSKAFYRDVVGLVPTTRPSETKYT